MKPSFTQRREKFHSGLNRTGSAHRQCVPTLNTIPLFPVLRAAAIRASFFIDNAAGE